MVQRKTIDNRISLKDSSSLEEVKKTSNKMRPSIQILDIKAKGADLAKKMKKSRPFKRSTELDNLKKSSLRKDHLSSDHYEPPKQSPPRQGLSSPNYMKATSSSEARKEQKQVSTKTPSKSVIESLSKRLFSSSCPPKSVGRSSSLSKVRTLTKTPSFKPSRSIKSACDVKRNTCSSTMKDSKFPNYLNLSLGATESQGTSILKVCPYSYCSLNGHRHSAPPPLKSFLCARRRMMKEQRSLMPVDSSPCKTKPFLDDNEVGVANEPVKKDDQEEESNLKEDECVYDVGSFHWESSDMDLEEEGNIFFTRLEEENGDFTPSDQESDNTMGNEIEYLLDDNFSKKDDVNVEFSQDEIIECHDHLSDLESPMNDGCEETELDQFFQGDFDEEFPVPDQPEEDTNLIQDMEDSGFTKKPSHNSEEVNKHNFKNKISKGKRNRREESEELKSFNPREPNFLDVELDPEGEKVDLKHQEIDERKNSEEWMVDFALRKAVDNLAPARKKKVAMLVAAFETVIPTSRNCEARARPVSSEYGRVQACN